MARPGRNMAREVSREELVRRRSFWFRAFRFMRSSFLDFALGDFASEFFALG